MLFLLEKKLGELELKKKKKKVDVEKWTDMKKTRYRDGDSTHL